MQKKLLSHKERLTIKSNGKEHTLDLSSTDKPGDLLKAPEICRTDEGTMPMTLLVRKPDLLGSAMWEFRHGGNSVSARISDTDWLSSFHAGQETIHPGSALTCTVHYSYGYDAAGELQNVKHEVVKVHNVINPPTGRQLRIDDT